MAQQKKMVEEITSMDEDFAKWYTDVVKKAELCEYTSVKGCMVQTVRLCNLGEHSAHHGQHVQGNRPRERMHAYVYSRKSARKGKGSR